MKNKIFIFVIGLLVGAIIASAGFLIFGGNKGKMDRKDFDPSQFQDGSMTPPSGFSRDKDSMDFEKKDKNDNNTVQENNTDQEKTTE